MAGIPRGSAIFKPPEFFFKLLDMRCFWTTMAARFREQAATNCLDPFDEAALVFLSTCIFPEDSTLPKLFL
jgi:hypothetical protein